MSHSLPDSAEASPVRTVAEAGAHVTRVCFKHGPPTRTGIELEWLLIDLNDDQRRPDLDTLLRALGSHAPRTLSPTSPALPLPAGGLVTVEPGGQLEISSAPSTSVGSLTDAMCVDVEALKQLIEPTGFTLSDRAVDVHRTPRRLLQTPRYAAMDRHFAAVGPAGLVMMTSTAAMQVCLDLGTVDEAADRWRVAHYLGPVLSAAFANSPRSASTLAPAASIRMSSWWQLDPARTLPPALTAGPAEYVERVLDTAVLVRRAADDTWLSGNGRTLRQWIESGEPVNTADIDLHLSTLFPPVRPQGYLEFRYLDAQPGNEWVAPLAVVAALFADPQRVRDVIRVCAPGADRWPQATAIGLDDPVLRTCAAEVLDLALPGIDALGFDGETAAVASRLLERRLGDGISPGAEIPVELTGAPQLQEGSR